MSTKAVLAAGKNVVRAAVGKVVFLREEERDLYLLSRIVEVAARHEDDGSFVLVVFCRERMTTAWLAGLKLVVFYQGRFEVHKVAETRLTRSGRLVQIFTCRCRQLQNQHRLSELLDKASVLFMTTRAALVAELQ